MANKIHQGEPLAISGQLKDNNVVTTAYGLSVKVYSARGELLQTVPLTVDTTTNYYSCSIDTSNLVGMITFRFVASTTQGEIIINDDDIVQQIFP